MRAERELQLQRNRESHATRPHGLHTTLYSSPEQNDAIDSLQTPSQLSPPRLPRNPADPPRQRPNERQRGKVQTERAVDGAEEEEGANDVHPVRPARCRTVRPLRRDAVRFPPFPPLPILTHCTNQPVSLNSYIRAFEVGRPPTVPKYEMHIKLRTVKSGPVIRNHLRLPHPVKTDLRICVICPPDSKTADAARAAGASLVGEDAVFDAVKEGRIDFDRCVCHADSLQKLNKAGLGRILGPRGLMPSAKTGTVVTDVAGSVRDMVGGSEYRERLGVVRMAVGQLGFTPEEMRRNIRSFIDQVKKDIAQLSDRVSKDIHEVVSALTDSEIVWREWKADSCAGTEFDELAGLQLEWRV